MGGQSNIFNKPETIDPFGAPTSDFATGIFDQEKRNYKKMDQMKKSSQAEWERSINNPGNKIR